MQISRFKDDQLHYIATQNTHHKAIYLWDLYRKRQQRPLDDKAPDVPEGVINYKNEGVEINGFTWQNNAANLHSLATIMPRKESYFATTGLGAIEKRSAENDDGKSTSAREDRFNVTVNLTKSDKTTSVEKLPLEIGAFCVDDRLRSALFGMERNTSVLIDLRDRSVAKYFGRMTPERPETTRPEPTPYHISYNGQNDVIFAKTDQVNLFDIRRVCLQGTSAGVVDRHARLRPQSGIRPVRLKALHNPLREQDDAVFGQSVPNLSLRQAG